MKKCTNISGVFLWKMTNAKFVSQKSKRIKTLFLNIWRKTKTEHEFKVRRLRKLKTDSITKNNEFEVIFIIIINRI